MPKQIRSRHIISAIQVAAIFLTATPLFSFHLTYFTHSMPKAIWFFFFIEIMTFLWVPLAIQYPQFRPKFRSPLFFVVSAFTVLLSISTIFSLDPIRSFWSVSGRMSGLFFYLHLWALFTVLSSLRLKWQQWQTIFYSSVVFSTIVCSIGVFFELFTYIDNEKLRLLSTTGNPLLLASLCTFHLFVILLLLLRERSFRLRVALVFSLLLHGITLILTGSRSTILAISISFFVVAICLVYTKSRSHRMKKRLMLLLVSLVLLACSFLFFVRASPGAQWAENHLPFSVHRILTEDFGADRIELWSIAFSGFMQRPLLGWGLDGFVVVFDSLFSPSEYPSLVGGVWFSRAHSQPFDILVAGGVFVFFAYLSIWVTAMYLASKRFISLKDLESLILLGALIAMFTYSLFMFDHSGFALSTFMLLAFVSRPETKEDLHDLVVTPSFTYAASIGVAVCIFLTCLLPPVRNSIIHKQAMTSLESGNFEETEKLFMQLFQEEHVYSDDHIRHTFQTFFDWHVLQEHRSTAMHESLMRLSTAAEAAVSRRPFDYQMRYIAAYLQLFLVDYGDLSRMLVAENHVLKLDELGPRRSERLEIAAMIAVRRGNPAQAVLLYDEALLIAQSRSHSLGFLLLNKSVILLRQGAYVEAFGLFGEMNDYNYPYEFDVRIATAISESMLSRGAPEDPSVRSFIINHFDLIGSKWPSNPSFLKARVIVDYFLEDYSAMAAHYDMLLVADSAAADGVSWVFDALN